MPGRPKGSKNRTGHGAGGARPGAGRKRKDGATSEQAAAVSAVKALKRLTGEDVTGNLTIMTETGTRVQFNFQDFVASFKASEPPPSPAPERLSPPRGDLHSTSRPGPEALLAESEVVPVPSIADDGDNAGLPEGAAVNGYITENAVPDKIVVIKSNGARHDPSIPAIVTAKPLAQRKSIPRVPAPQLLSTEELDGTQGIPVPQEGAPTDIVTAFNFDALRQMFSNTDDPAAAARLALIADPNVSHTAIAAALNAGNSIPEALMPLNAVRPSLVTGPFMVTPRSDDAAQASEDVAPTFYGPVDPSILPTQHVVAVYYVVYEKGVGGTGPIASALRRVRGDKMSNSRSSGPRTGPGAPVAGPSLAAALSGEATDVPWPAHIELAGRRRAPRRCLICGDFDCKGRGGRTFCPHYDPSNADHLLNPFVGKRKRDRTDSESAYIPVPGSPYDSALDEPLPPGAEEYPHLHPSLLAEMRQAAVASGIDLTAGTKSKDASRGDAVIDPSLAESQ